MRVTVVFGAQFHELEVDPADGAEIFKIQVTSLTDVAPDRLLISGVGSGFLHDLSDMSSLKEGQLITVTEGDASAIPHPQARPSLEAPASAGDTIYGFLPASTELLGQNGTTTRAGTLTSFKVLGLYFSAHWCPPCRAFTPKLAQAYHNIKSAGKAFEIVFVSSDKSEAEFASYHSTMPWLAMPFAMRDLKAALSEMFQVRGIPALILLDASTGQVISNDGRGIITNDPDGQQFPWVAAGSGEARGSARPGSAPSRGPITLSDLQKALAPKSAETEAREQAQRQAQQGIAEMERRITSSAQHVLIYQDKAVQAQALACIPVADIQKKAAEAPGNLGARDAVARHLLAWFKSYFAWVNNAPCQHCGASNTRSAGGDRPNSMEKAYGAGIVELYQCDDCHKTTRFPRYNHPGKLMETRKGRCGEWANAFTLCCIAMGFEARHVVDWTDHVWTEVFSEEQQRWIHCDACENSWDSPLLYSEGWGKKLSYVIAFSSEEVVDVTCRYTRQWNDCLTRRTKCREMWLGEFLAALRGAKLASLAPTRTRILQARAEVEARELQPRNPAPAEPDARSTTILPGRTTGSLEWRAARGEIGNGDVGTDASPALASQTLASAEAVARPCATPHHATPPSPPPPRTAIKSAVHGGSHADTVAFDDAAQVARYVSEGARGGGVRGVTVWASPGDAGLVFGIQLHYDEARGSASSAGMLDGPQHVASSPLPPPRTILLKEGERITQVGGRAGALIDRLEFTIRSCTGDVCSERVEAFGGSGGSPFACRIAEGEELVGVAGGRGGHLHNICFYTYPSPESSKSSGEAEASACAGGGAGGGGKSGCGSSSAGARDGHAALDAADAAKLRMQHLIRHFFFEIQKAGGTDANTAAAAAVEKARQWLVANPSPDTTLPS